MSKYFLVCCLILTSVDFAGGQQLPQRNAQYARQRTAAVLSRVPDEIKAMREPVLRASLSIQVATFLWTNKPAEARDEAERIATEAFADLESNKGVIPPSYLSSFRSELLALLQTHAPELAARLSKRYELRQGSVQSMVAYDMLGTKEGAGRGVDMLINVIRGGELPSSIIFFLHRLEETKPDEKVRVLSEIINLGERKPDAISMDDLFLLKHQYIAADVPAELQRRYLNLVVSKTRVSTDLDGMDQGMSYHLLRIVLPEIQKQLPTVYPQASAQLANLRTSISDITLETEDTMKRINQSADPLNQMITEADAAKDDYKKRRLLTEAAQIALNKDQLKLAVDLIMRVESGEKNFGLFRDQLLEKVVNRAIEQKDVTVADYAASKIQSHLARSSALQRIALYFFRSKDLISARQRFDTAVKLIDSAENNASKASAMLRVIALAAVLDDARVFEMAQATIKIVNNLATPRGDEKPESAEHKHYLDGLLQVAYNIIPTFRALSQRDEIGAFALANSIRSQELKTAAIFGASTGVRGVVENAPPAAR